MPHVMIKQKYQVTIPASVREEIGLHEGDTLEVRVEGGHIVFIPQQQIAKEGGDDRRLAPLSSYIGAAKGLYETPQQADEYIRNQRKEWRD